MEITAISSVPATTHSKFHIALSVTLQWSNKFGESANDYDLCKSTETPAACKPYNHVQNGNDNPFDCRNFTCPPDCNIQVRLVSGAAQTIKLYAPNTYFSNATTACFLTACSDIRPLQGRLLQVGGSMDTPNTIESYSSKGPTQILYPTPETRMKPDVVATTDVSVTGVGGFGSPFQGLLPPRLTWQESLLFLKGLTAAQVTLWMR